MALERRSLLARRGALAALQASATMPLLAFAAALVPAAAVALAQPVWSRVDEAQHFDFIVQLAHGTWPIADQTTLRPETVRIMDRTGIYRWFQPNGDAQPTDTAPSTFRQPPADMPIAARSQWFWRHIWYFSYESFQPPLYYLLMAPLYLAGSAAAGPLAAIYLLRLVNALMVAALAPAAWLLARELLPGRLGFAIAATAAAVAIPGLLVNLTQVTNDTLAALLGTVLVLLAVRFLRTGYTVPKAIVLGVLLGAALLTKLTVAGLVPALVVGVLAAPLARRAGGRALARHAGLAAIALAVAGVLLAPWVLLNEHLYRKALPPHEFMSYVFRADPLTPRLLHGDIGHALLTFWTGEPVGVVPLTNAVIQYASFWTLAACLGLALLGLAGRPFPRGALLVLATAVAGEAVLAITMPVFSQVGGLTPGRYLYPAAGAATALLVAGTWTLLPIPPARAALVLCMVGVAAAATSGFLQGYGGDRAQLEAHYAPPPGPGVPVHATGTAGDVRVTVDRFLDESAGGSVWIHVDVDNGTRRDIEWWPRPIVVLDGQAPVRTDYGRSQALPETIHPGAHYSVWLVAPTTSHGPYHTLDVTFEAVAVHDYRLLEDLEMQAAIPPPQP